MIEFDDLYLADIKDDFEEAGREGRNFTLWGFINNDLSRAFAIGYLYRTLIEEKYWIPVIIRKQMRRINEGMDKYNSQLNWLNNKYITDKSIKVREYVSYILDNIFPDSEEDIFKLAVILGINLSSNE